MRYIYLSISIILIFVLCFCTSGKESINESNQNSSISKRLSESAIFNIDSAKFAEGVATDAQKNEARKLFLAAIDLLSNKQNAKESIFLFIEAIRFYPESRTYFYLTKAYIAINDTIYPRKANDMAFSMGYTDDYELMFNDALIYTLTKDTLNCIYSLDEAIRYGFLNKNKIVDEKRFDFLRDHPSYISLMVNNFNDDEKLKIRLFKNYLKGLPDLNQPYELVIDSISNRGQDNYINYDYAVFVPGMEDGRFSRDVTNEYLYVGKINLENNFTAVVYKTYFAIADTLNPVKFYVQTYDSLGKAIDNEMIGCYCSPTNSQSFKILADNTIEITSYTYKWRDDPLEKGYAGNQIISFDIAKPEKIQVIEDGSIKREGVAVQQTESTKQGG